MSTICNPALSTKPITSCVGELTAGKVSYNLLWMYFLVTDITTGRTFPMSFMTGADGTVNVDLSDIEWSDKHAYKFSIHKQDNISTPETIYIGGVDTKELELNFVRCDENGEVFALPAVVLELA